MIHRAPSGEEDIEKLPTSSHLPVMGHAFFARLFFARDFSIRSRSF
jgi:hypothetical protein